MEVTLLALVIQSEIQPIPFCARFSCDQDACSSTGELHHAEVGLMPGSAVFLQLEAKVVEPGPGLAGSPAARQLRVEVCLPARCATHFSHQTHRMQAAFLKHLHSLLGLAWLSDTKQGVAGPAGGQGARTYAHLYSCSRLMAAPHSCTKPPRSSKVTRRAEGGHGSTL